MNKEDLNSWRHNPTTVAVIKYLDDYAMELARNLATKDFGNLSASEVAREQAQIFGMCSAFSDIANLEFEDVDRFYNPEKEEKDEEV